jgi:hypothetical protein
VHTKEKDDKQLLREFVASFEKLDDLSSRFEMDPIAYELSFGDSDEDGLKKWLPIYHPTDRSYLEEFYKKVSPDLPPLYEELVLTYRWATVDLKSYRLLANPPGADLSGLLTEMIRDKGLWDALVPNGYLQFGKAPDVNYDPVCFDFNRRLRDGDCKIVQLDHEEILCNHGIREVSEIAPSFRQLMIQTIELVARKTPA